MRKIETELSQTSISVARAVLSSKEDTGAILAGLRDHNLSLQKERTDILTGAGFPADYLDQAYVCASCSDTGYVDGKPCVCLKDLTRKEAFDRLNGISPVKFSDFASFDLSYYPAAPDGQTGVVPRERMQSILAFCRDYARDFTPRSENLLMLGRTGLGKTHLSLAIAGEVTKKGFGVVYGSAQNLLSKVEAERFSRERTTTQTMDSLLACDLLILDDLGSEFTTPFVISALYNIINTRLCEGKATVISANLSGTDLTERYSEKIASRLIGEYRYLRFFGQDIRQLKHKMGR